MIIAALNAFGLCLLVYVIARAFITRPRPALATGSDLARAASRKHVRIAWAATGNVARFHYYNDSGRRITARYNVATGDVARLKAAAIARGYAVIVF